MLDREARTMMTEKELLELAEKEAGRLLTETEKWFVWNHSSRTFSEIREMLDEKNLPNWPRFS